MRLGILASHPIQYHAPWFRRLAKEVDLEIFFARRPTQEEQGTGFGKAFEWDIDLLSGYEHTFLENKSRRPGVNRFFGCDCPQITEIICGSRITDNREQITKPKAFDAFIVCGWNLKCYWQAIRACRRAGTPVLVRGDSQFDPTQSWLKRALKRLLYPLMLRQFDGFLSPGERNREYLQHYRVPEEKIFFVPHFVDNERFAAQANALRDSRFEIRDSWNIPGDAFVALFCGKLIPKKRPLDLVKAAAVLLRSDPQLKLHLLFAGSGELGGELRANCNVTFDAESSLSINREQMTDNAKPTASFAGFLNQTQVSKAYVAADCLVLPSDYRETWGLTVNEAMACRLLAVVSNAVGCAPDLIDEGKTGFCFRLGNSAELAERLNSVILLKNEYPQFTGALLKKMNSYCIETALSGTLNSVSTLRECRR
jgi:glycosyltransferase involved in cell wall biosynthesis